MTPAAKASPLHRPWPVLSAGVPFGQFTDIIRIAADKGGASGFIAGRAHHVTGGELMPGAGRDRWRRQRGSHVLRQPAISSGRAPMRGTIWALTADITRLAAIMQRIPAADLDGRERGQQHGGGAQGAHDLDVPPV